MLDSWPKIFSTPHKAQVAEVTTAKTTAENAGAVTSARANVVAPPSAPTDSEPTQNPTAEFVKHVHDGACHDFGTVLGPEANDAHKNHFHLDMKERRSGFCQ